jgi:cytochrome P450
MKQLRHKRSAFHAIPGSQGLPVIGETIAWRRDPLKFLQRHYSRYGRIFRSNIYDHPEITMLGPQANEFILSSHRDYFEWAGGYDLFLNRNLFQDNLFLQDGEVHDRHRQIILPAFHGKALRGYFAIMDQLSKSYGARWARSERIAAYPELRNLTFEIAARCLLGASTGEEVERFSQLFDTLARGTQGFPQWDFVWNKFGRARRAMESLREYFQAALRERRSHPGPDALGMLLAAADEYGQGLSDQEIVSHIMMIVLAAHDTTTSNLTWLLYEIDRHPEIAARLLVELNTVLSDGPLTTEHIPRLRYLDLVLKEVERLHSALTGLPRKVVKPFDFDGYHVPGGSIVYYSILFTHRMPEVFANPESFEPERFSPPRSEDERIPFSLIGFGAGPRACIGRGFARFEMKVIAANLLQGFEWSVMTGQSFRSLYSPTNRPQDGLQIKLKARNRS